MIYWDQDRNLHELSFHLSFSLYLERIKEKLECINRDRVQMVNYKSKFHNSTCTHWRHVPDWPIRGPSVTPDVLSLAAVPRVMQRPCEMRCPILNFILQLWYELQMNLQLLMWENPGRPREGDASLRTVRVTSLAVPRDAITIDWGEWCTVTWQQETDDLKAD